jgi:hypothetical protein
MSAGAAILAWVLMAVNAWGAKPIPQDEVARVDEVRQRAAESIYQVSYDVDEVPLFQGNHGRARTALLLTSIEALESRFLNRILTGHCIKPECDNGRAWSGFQIHLGPHGLRFLPGGKAAQCFVRSPECFGAQELTDDWSLQTRAGLAIYRTNPRQFSTWLEANSQANAWYAKNPPPATDEQVASGVVLAEK